MSNESRENKERKVGIRLLTLNDCDYCVWLKSELDSCGITYTNIDVNQFSDFADAIEGRFMTKTYPIVFIDLGDDIVTVVGETELVTSDTLRTFDTIPHLVSIIKSYIK